MKENIHGISKQKNLKMLIKGQILNQNVMKKSADDPLVLHSFLDFSLTTPVLSSWTILIPVAMDMGGTESEAVVQQCWVNHVTCVCSLQQVPKVAQVPVASSHTISSTVLIQNKDLTWAKPTLQAEQSRKEAEGLVMLQKQKGVTCHVE